MTHIITSLCLRDSSCVDVCPVECIIPGEPVDKWPWFYIDPAVCIDCGACIPECPFGAILSEEEVGEYVAKGGEVQSMPAGTAGFSYSWRAQDKFGRVVTLRATRALEPGQPVNLFPDILPNYMFFNEDAEAGPIGPGYKVLEDEQD